MKFQLRSTHLNQYPQIISWKKGFACDNSLINVSKLILPLKCRSFLDASNEMTLCTLRCWSNFNEFLQFVYVFRRIIYTYSVIKLFTFIIGSGLFPNHFNGFIDFLLTGWVGTALAWTVETDEADDFDPIKTPINRFATLFSKLPSTFVAQTWIIKDILTYKLRKIRNFYLKFTTKAIKIIAATLIPSNFDEFYTITTIRSNVIKT